MNVNSSEVSDGAAGNGPEDGVSMSLQEKLQPAISLLFPRTDKDKTLSDRKHLLRYFEENDVQDLSDLAKFDLLFLMENLATHRLNHPSVWSPLAQICEYIATFGTDRFLELINANTRTEQHVSKKQRLLQGKPNVSVVRADMEAQLKEFHRRCKQIQKPCHARILQMTPAQLQELSMVQARNCLRTLFRDANPWVMMMYQPPEDEPNFPHQIVLTLLQRFPLLASISYHVEDDGYLHAGMYPLHFFAWCGCYDKAVVEQILQYYPRVLYKNKEGIIDFLEAAYSLQHGRIPLRCFQSLLSVLPQPAHGRNDYDENMLLLERLINLKYGADVLDYVYTFLSQDVDRLTLTNALQLNWSLGIHQAQVANKVIPRVRQLELDPYEWTPEGAATIQQHLATQDHAKLESLTMSVFLSDEENDNDTTFATLLHKKTNAPATKHLNLKGRLHFRRPNPNEHVRDFIIQDRGLRQIASVISSTTSDWKLDTLTLERCSVTLEFVHTLFTDSQDHIGSLDVQLDGQKFACPWEPIDETATQELRLGRLNLYNIRFPSTACWEAFWRGVSRLSKLQCLMLAPGVRGNSVEWIDTALTCCSTMTGLTTICLGPHTNDHVSVDITRPLLDLLHHNTRLEFLQVEGSYEYTDGTIGCLSYQIHVERLCEALARNKSLQFLFLRGVQLVGTNISQSFLRVLRDCNNTTLEFADICDDQHFYTIIPKDSWRRDVHHGFTYESYPDAWQIYYLTSFNRFGRGKVQDKATKAAEFVDLLVNIHGGVGMSDQERQVHDEIVRVAHHAQRENPAGLVNTLYGLLGKDPELWCNAVKRNIEAFSHRYGLLRESPGLWCGK